jgi:hypothetical protein
MRPRIKFLLSATLFSLITSIAGVGDAGVPGKHGERPVRVAACDAPRRAGSTSRGPAPTSLATNGGVQGDDTGTMNEPAVDDDAAGDGDDSDASGEQGSLAEASLDGTESDGDTMSPSRSGGVPGRSAATSAGADHGGDQTDHAMPPTSSGRFAPRVAGPQRSSAGSADRSHLTMPDATGGDTSERSEPSVTERRASGGDTSERSEPSVTERRAPDGDTAAQQRGGKRGAAPRSVSNRTGAPAAQVTRQSKRGPNDASASNGHGRGPASHAHGTHAAASRHGHGGQSSGPNMRAHRGHSGKAMARRVALLRFKRCLAVHHGSRERAACGRNLHGRHRPHGR